MHGSYAEKLNVIVTVAFEGVVNGRLKAFAVGDKISGKEEKELCAIAKGYVIEDNLEEKPLKATSNSKRSDK